jgi:hypothetical protein
MQTLIEFPLLVIAEPGRSQGSAPAKDGLVMLYQHDNEGHNGQSKLNTRHSVAKNILKAS